MAEYVEFINAMFTASGKQPMNLPNAMLNFDVLIKMEIETLAKLNSKRNSKKD